MADNILVDEASSRKYCIESHLGTGSFGVCYRVRDVIYNKNYACKVINTTKVEEQYLETVQNEIEINKQLKHKHVVSFFDWFEFNQNICILLELCSRGSMSDLIRRRKFLTKPEAKYYMAQVLSGVDYLHNLKIIHRDLKLTNLMISATMETKICDFGLAKKMNGEEKRFSLCGTPNYIAPEMVERLGHTLSVDIWALGCIIYTLLVGKTPFASKSKNDTFKKVQSCKFSMHPRLDYETRAILVDIFQYEPTKRPSTKELLKNPFFTTEVKLLVLPFTALHEKPTFPEAENSKSMVLRDISNRSTTNRNKRIKIDKVEDTKQTPTTPKCKLCASYVHLTWISEQIKQIMLRKTIESEKMKQQDEKNLTMVTRWAEHGNENCAFGYNMSNGILGVLYTDLTYLVLKDNDEGVFISKTGAQSRFTLNNFNSKITQKIRAGLYFRKCLSKLNSSIGNIEGRTEADPVFVVDWRRYNVNVITVLMSSGAFQINFLGCHTKLLLDPVRKILCRVDQKEVKTFSIPDLVRDGCDEKLKFYLGLTLDKVDAMNFCRSHGVVTHRK